MSIVTRSTSGYNVVAKGSGLTNTEADNNIYELLSDPSYPGVDMAALHRSPNAVTAMFVYDTSKDSDGGAWTEKCQHTSWYNEALMGKWLGAEVDELNARYVGSSVSSTELVPNPELTDVAAWTNVWSPANFTLVNGQAIRANTGNRGVLRTTAISLSAGKTYRVRVTLTNSRPTVANATPSNYGAISVGASVPGLANNVDSPTKVALPGGTLDFYITPTVACSALDVYSNTNTYTDIESISCKEVTALNTTGGDYFQLTTDGKFYRLWKNLLQRTQEFSNSYWTKSATTVATTAVAPDGSSTAFNLSPTSGSAWHIIYSPTFNPGTYSFSAYAKANGYSKLGIGDAQGGTSYAVFDLAGGTLLSQANTISTAITSVGSGWYKIIVSAAITTGVRFGFSVVDPTYTSGNWASAWNATDTSSSVQIWGAQLEYGSTATTYEAKTTDGTVTEVFRGNKAKFPKLAGIVAEAANVTIYDLTEPGRPMWMRFIAGGADQTVFNWLLSSGGTVTSCAALNGTFGIGRSGAWARFVTFNFMIERCRALGGSGNTLDLKGFVANRNAGLGGTIALPVLASDTINAVAMTVLPDAPLDPVTGLAVPTIAVATGGGISVIKDNGTVVNSSITLAFNGVTLTPKKLTGHRNYYDFYWVKNIRSLGSSFVMNSDLFDGVDRNVVKSVAPNSSLTIKAGSAPYNRLPLPAVNISLQNDTSDWKLSVHTAISSIFNIGWACGEPRRAYINETYIGSTSAGNLVTGDSATFDNGIGNWTNGDSTVSWDGTNKRLVATCPSLYRSVLLPLSLTPGKAYKLTATISGGVSPYLFFITSSGTDCSPMVGGASGTFSSWFVATETNHKIAFQNRYNGADTMYLDDVSVVEVAYDRSYKAACAQVYGTLSSAQVASNTSLVAYSGFSAANYLREPYSADLDFGTGEWSVGAWVNMPTTLPVGSFPVVGSEVVTNGDFSGGSSSWTLGASWSVSGGVATKSGVGTDSIYQDIPALTVNSFYKIELDQTYVGGQFSILLRVGGAGAVVYNGALPAINGRVTLIIPASAAATRISFFMAGSTATGTIDNVSIREVAPALIADRSYSTGPKINLGVAGAGNLTATAYDGTTTRTVTTSAAYNTATWCKAEATYKAGKLAILVNGNEVAVTQGNPLQSLNSRYNLLERTDDFTNAYWGKTYGTVDATKVADPDGALTAHTFTATSSNALLDVAVSGTATNTVSVVGGIWVRRRTGSGAVEFFVGNGTAVTLNLTSSWQYFSNTQVGYGTYWLFRIRVTTAGDAVDVWHPDLRVANGVVTPTYQRVSTATDFDFQAPLTIGNSYALDAPFPGSIALLKLSATAPTYDQALWMYEQEKQMFRDGAQCVLPDANSIVDLTYDSQTDRWKAISSTNESYWSGLVRTKVEPVPAGSYTKLAANSGIHLVARSTTNPGVDITIPKINIKEEYKRKAESAQKTQKNLVVFDFDTISFTATTTNGSKVLTSVASVTGTPYRDMGLSGTGVAVGTTLVGTDSTTYYISAAATASNTGVTMTQTDYRLPVGYTASLVFLGGVQKIEGATKDFIRLFDGFRETIRFNAAPSSGSWIQIHAYVDQN